MKGDTSKTNIIVDNDATLTSRMIDYTNKIFENKWKAIRPVGRNYSGRILWEFQCLNCGCVAIRTASNISQCTCDCQSRHHDKYTMSFYDWCIKNNHEDWIALWDDDINKFDIHEIGYGSTTKCWFRCNNYNINHHSEQYELCNLTSGCQKGIFCKQCSSVAQTGIDMHGNDFLEKYWDYDLNEDSPWDVAKGSNKYIYLKCSDGVHKSHKTTANNANKYKYSCPYCVEEMKYSKLHTKVIDYLKELGFDMLQEYDCNIVPINPNNNYKLPYDIEVIDMKLIIEVNGEQHYSEKSLFIKLMASRNNSTCEEALAHRLWLDNYKKQYALDCGYNYLVIPYWLEKNDEYKNVIINKINEIKNLTYILPDVVNQG